MLQYGYINYVPSVHNDDRMTAGVYCIAEDGAVSVEFTKEWYRLQVFGRLTDAELLGVQSAIYERATLAREEILEHCEGGRKMWINCIQLGRPMSSCLTVQQFWETMGRQSLEKLVTTTK